MSRSSWLLIVEALLVWHPPLAWAGLCALCRQALSSGGNPGLIQGFYWSILLIAGVPLVMMATIGLIAWRHRRQRRLAKHVSRLPSFLQSVPRN